MGIGGHDGEVVSVRTFLEDVLSVALSMSIFLLSSRGDIIRDLTLVADSRYQLVRAATRVQVALT